MSLNPAPSQIVGSAQVATGGRQIAAKTAGVTLTEPTATVDQSEYDLHTIEACNIDTVRHLLTIYFGGTDNSDKIMMSIPAQQGPFVVLNARRLLRGLPITAVADADDVINISLETDQYMPPQ